VERASRPDGASIQWGIPSKALRETALYFSGLRQRGLYSIDYLLKKRLTVSDLMYREKEVVRNVEAVLQRNIDLHGIEMVYGNAVLEDAHHIGEMSSELVHIGTLVLVQGGTIDYFRETIYNYPTLSDLYTYAAYDGIGLWRQWLREQDQRVNARAETQI
jgi:pyruvate/2-oxoglutarate dehydrogenase complex dihydrolipoamide dehydrogenase (E3) component